MNTTALGNALNVIDLSKMTNSKSKNENIQTNTNDSSIDNSSQTLQIKLRPSKVRTEEEVTQQNISNCKKHGDQPIHNSIKSFNTLEHELNAINNEISQHNSSIKSSDWDFTYINGKIQVKSNTLDSSDKQFIEDKLNSNSIITDSINQFNQAVVDYYQPSKEDHYGGAGLKIAFLSSTHYMNVEDQIDKGIFSYKKMLNDTIESNGNSQVIDKYVSAIDSAEKYLRVSVDTYA